MSNLNPASKAGYQSFMIGGFTFTRDEYFTQITWPKGSHILPIEDFLKALQRDVAWGFFTVPSASTAYLEPLTTTAKLTCLQVLFQKS